MANILCTNIKLEKNSVITGESVKIAVYIKEIREEAVIKKLPFLLCTDNSIFRRQ